MGGQQCGNTALGKVFREPGITGHQWVVCGFGKELLVFYLFASDFFLWR